jgi:hypothetical protein
MLSVSNDTLLRVVRRKTLPGTDPSTFVGTDDWAFGRNHHYGTIVCDLKRRRVVTLLPDRCGMNLFHRHQVCDRPNVRSRLTGMGADRRKASGVSSLRPLVILYHCFENHALQIVGRYEVSGRLIVLVVDSRPEDKRGQIEVQAKKL